MSFQNVNQITTIPSTSTDLAVQTQFMLTGPIQVHICLLISGAASLTQRQSRGRSLFLNHSKLIPDTNLSHTLFPLSGTLWYLLILQVSKNGYLLREASLDHPPKLSPDYSPSNHPILSRVQHLIRICHRPYLQNVFCPNRKDHISETLSILFCLAPLCLEQAQNLMNEYSWHSPSVTLQWCL